MWRTTLCHGIALKSFTVINVAFQVVLFFIALIITVTESNAGLNEHMFLGLHAHTLDFFGMRMPWKIVNEGAVWRLLTSVYLTHSFMTLVLNSIAQLILAFQIEKVIGARRMAAYYILTGVSANLFAIASTDRYAAGPEPVIFGLLAGFLALFIFHWDQIELLFY